MNQATFPEVVGTTEVMPAQEIDQCESRLEALCELVGEELNGGIICDNQVARYTRRLTGDIDQAFAEVNTWLASDH